MARRIKISENEAPVHILLDRAYDDKVICYRDENFTATLLNNELKTRCHIHHFFEIEILLESNAEVEIDNTSFKAEKGCCWFCMPGTIHTVNIRQNPKLLSLKFDESTIGGRLNKYIVSDNNFFVSNFDQSELDRIYGAFMLAIDTAKRCEDLSLMVIKGFLQFLIALIVEKNYSSLGSVRMNEINPTVLKAIVYTKLHISQPITLTQISEKFGYTPNYLSRLFKKEIGKNYLDFLTEERLRIANTMLKNSDLPINEIAKQTGFASTAYFCRVYKKLYGKTPTQFKTV